LYIRIGRDVKEKGFRGQRAVAASPQIKKGAADAAGCVEGLRKKVLRIDGPFRAQGFLSLMALRAEGCGLPLCGNAYKVSVTSLPYCVI